MKVRWKEVNWSLTNTEIVRLTGRTLGTVRNRRSQLAPGTTGELVRADGVDWSSVDWSATDEALAKTYGRAVRTVYLHRLTQNPELHIYPLKAQWEAIDWSLSDIQIAKLLGISRQAVYVQRKRRLK